LFINIVTLYVAVYLFSGYIFPMAKPTIVEVRFYMELNFLWDHWSLSIDVFVLFYNEVV